MDNEPAVHIVDDDEAIRDAILFQLETAGLTAVAYPSAEAFLEGASDIVSGCLLTDLRMPGMSGIELVHVLKERGFTLPIIMMTGHGDVSVAVEAMKAGIRDFIEKPLDDEHLLTLVREALAAASTPGEAAQRERDVRDRFNALSPREHDVLRGVVAGKPNKVIAIDLGISPRTVEVYRAGLMTKTGAAGLSELMRMALLAGL